MASITIEHPEYAAIYQIAINKSFCDCCQIWVCLKCGQVSYKHAYRPSMGKLIAIVIGDEIMEVK